MARHIPKGKDFNEELVAFSEKAKVTEKTREPTVIEEECMV
ncbi:hypothetical protein [Clostridium botulinum]|nr:hypothetical protein [Clostridium botulinum]APQ72029.1 hypothetical protein RSJ9_2473 [Clostridium botulinum]